MPPENDAPDKAQEGQGEQGEQKSDSAAELASLKETNVQLTERLNNQSVLVARLLSAASSAGREKETAEKPDFNLKDALEEDPEKALDAYAQTKVGPVFQQLFEQNATRERELAASKLSDWPKYEKEIDEFMERVDLPQRARPGAYRVAYDFVKAKHLPEIEADMAKTVDAKVKAAVDERLRELKLRVPAIEIESSLDSKPIPKDSLSAKATQDDIVQARRFGIPLEEWMIYKEQVGTEDDVIQLEKSRKEREARNAKR